jgi:hypothetical protein
MLPQLALHRHGVEFTQAQYYLDTTYIARLPMVAIGHLQPVLVITHMYSALVLQW